MFIVIVVVFVVIVVVVVVVIEYFTEMMGVFLWCVTAKDRSVTEQTRAFYAKCGSTLEEVVGRHLQQTSSSSLKYAVDSAVS